MKTTIIGTLISLAICTNTAMAGVYVWSENGAAAPEGTPATASQVEEVPHATSTYVNGTSVKLSEMLPQLAPKGWIVNIGPGLDAARVAWEESTSWRNTIDAVAKNNKGVHILVDEQIKVIAAARSPDQLQYLATRNPAIWVLDPALSLRENMQAWASQSGWSLVWRSEWDYPILSRATIVGPLNGAGGAVDRALRPITTMRAPLKATYSTATTTILIEDGGVKSPKM